MKILFSGEKYYPPIGGAEYSALTLLERLAKKHDVEAFCLGDRSHFTEYNGIKFIIAKRGLESDIRLGMPRFLLVKERWKIVENYVKGTKPDLIISQDDTAPHIAEIALKHKVPVLLFLRNYNYLCISMLVGASPRKHNCLKHADVRKRIQYPLFKQLARWYKGLLHRADILISNSKFTRSVFKEWIGVDSHVVYPFIKLQAYKTKRNPECITFLRPKPHKGLDIFLKIADALPNEKFLVAGGSLNDTARNILRLEYEMGRRKNIEYIGWEYDMKKIYSRTDMLIMPSICYESFGRTAIEAMAAGIPCIVSSRGALPEAVENAAIMIEDVFDVKSWIDATIKLKEDAGLRKKLSIAAKKRAKKFNFESQYRKFEKILKNELGF